MSQQGEPEQRPQRRPPERRKFLKGITRRQFLVSLAVVVPAAILLRITAAFRGTNPLLIRPPGTSDEELLSKCIRCGECIRVCPTGGLQPSFMSPGLEGLWTPVLVSRLGYCDYSCNSCGQVCPTGAIPKLPLAEKRWVVLGVASIDEKRCLPFAEGIPCIVCEEVCPVPYKAVWLKQESVLSFQYFHGGEMITVYQPRVIRDLCIGCGICETKCPVDGESAIRVYRADNVLPYRGDEALPYREPPRFQPTL